MSLHRACYLFIFQEIVEFNMYLKQSSINIVYEGMTQFVFHRYIRILLYYKWFLHDSTDSISHERFKICSIMKSCLSSERSPTASSKTVI